MRILKLKYAISSLIIVLIYSCTNNIKTGKKEVSIKFNNGSTFCTGTYSINKKTGDPESMIGHWTYYYPNGIVENLMEFDKEGEMINKKTYNENGTLVFSEISTDYITTSNTFFDNGKIKTEMISKKDINGETETVYETEKRFYLNGQLLYQESFENGELEGTSTTFDSNGVQVLKLEYKNGFVINK